MNFLRILMRNLAQGPATDPFPFGETFTPDHLRGRVEFDPAACTACRSCEQVCVGNAIRFDKTPDGLRFMLWHNTCTFCGLCQHYCPTGAIHLTTDWHLAHGQDRKFDMVERGLIPNITCAGCGAKILATAPNAAATGPNPTQEDIERLRHLCPACRRKAAAAAKGGRS